MNKTKLISNIIQMIRSETELNERQIADMRKKLFKIDQENLERLYDSYYRFGVQNINDIILEQKDIEAK